jgi:hypothetical protein
MRDETIKRLRESLPPLLTVQQYCKLMSRCEASAYQDLKNKPGIAVKIGGSTRFVTDVVLDELARLPWWTPQKDRIPKAKVSVATNATRPHRQRNKQVGATGRVRHVEVRT